MKAKLKNHKANNDGTVAIYLAKGADEYALLGLRGKEIEITESKSETPETVPDDLATILFDYENVTVRLRRYLINQNKPDPIVSIEKDFRDSLSPTTNKVGGGDADGLD